MYRAFLSLAFLLFATGKSAVVASKLSSLLTAAGHSGVVSKASFSLGLAGSSVLNVDSIVQLADTSGSSGSMLNSSNSKTIAIAAIAH
jgi:hypothetical protein